MIYIVLRQTTPASATQEPPAGSKTTAVAPAEGSTTAVAQTTQGAMQTTPQCVPQAAQGNSQASDGIYFHLNLPNDDFFAFIQDHIY